MIRRFSIGALLCIAVTLIFFGVCFLGLWIPNEPSRTTYPIRGIDVSHHQRDIQWAQVKRSNIHFAYIKATEGADFRDDRFAENWKESASAGITRGAYHFFVLGKPGELQASNFIATVPIESNALPPAIDLEFSGYNKSQRPKPKEFQRDLSAFWDAIVANYRKMPVIYTTTDFQRHYLMQMPLERLWIREVITKPRQSWTFWQFSPRGRVPGIPSFVDLNVFNGELLDLEVLLNKQQ